MVSSWLYVWKEVIFFRFAENWRRRECGCWNSWWWRRSRTQYHHNSLKNSENKTDFDHHNFFLWLDDNSVSVFSGMICKVFKMEGWKFILFGKLDFHQRGLMIKRSAYWQLKKMFICIRNLLFRKVIECSSFWLRQSISFSHITSKSFFSDFFT